MTPFNGAGVTEATASVRVLTVDGTRRMSRGFFNQIPVGDMLDEGGALRPDANAWGYVDLGEPVIIGTIDARLVVMSRAEASAAAVRRVPRPESPGGSPPDWEAHFGELRAVASATNAAFDALIADLPQLYLGG